MNQRASHIAYQRCFNHAAREAVARCPHCQRFFCRECVTDHEGIVTCATCLKALAYTQAHRRAPKLFRLLAAATGLAVAWGVFYLAGRLMMLLPTTFHEGTIWTGR